jgi:hypothetical protein
MVRVLITVAVAVALVRGLGTHPALVLLLGATGVGWGLGRYVRDVHWARRLLGRTVRADSAAGEAGGRGVFPGRAACLVALARAFRAARLRRVNEAWGHLCAVTPEDLNGWECRVYAAVQALLLLEEARGDRPARALRLARRALPTGNVEVDLRLASSLLLEAWGSTSRLQDVLPAVRSGEASTAPLAFLGSLRLRYLQAVRGRPGAEPGAVLARVCLPASPGEVATAVEWARRLGDRSFADALQFAAVRREGPYRLEPETASSRLVRHEGRPGRTAPD